MTGLTPHDLLAIPGIERTAVGSTYVIDSASVFRVRDSGVRRIVEDLRALGSGEH